MIDACLEVSTDFSAIVDGEAVWMDGHIGVLCGRRPGGGGHAQVAGRGAVVHAGQYGGDENAPRHRRGPDLDQARQTALGGAAECEKEEGGEISYGQWKEYMDRYRRELRANHSKCWAEEELDAAVAAGITDGKRPHDLVTREEAAIMAMRARAGG